MTKTQAVLACSAAGFLIGLALIFCAGYLLFRHPEKIKQDVLARLLRLDRAPHSYWVQCLSCGLAFTSIALIGMIGASGGLGRELNGVEAILVVGLIVIAVGAVLAVIIANYVSGG